MTTALIKYSCEQLRKSFSIDKCISIKTIDKLIVDEYINVKCKLSSSTIIDEDNTINIKGPRLIFKNEKYQIYDSFVPSETYHNRFNRIKIIDLFIENFNDIFIKFEIPFKLIQFKDYETITDFKGDNFSILALDDCKEDIICHYVIKCIIHKNKEASIILRDDNTSVKSVLYSKRLHFKRSDNYKNDFESLKKIFKDDVKYGDDSSEPFLICYQTENKDNNFMFGSSIFSKLTILIIVVIIIIIIIIVVIIIIKYCKKKMIEN
jgi:hypothetical protein